MEASEDSRVVLKCRNSDLGDVPLGDDSEIRFKLGDEATLVVKLDGDRLEIRHKEVWGGHLAVRPITGYTLAVVVIPRD